MTCCDRLMSQTRNWTRTTIIQTEDWRINSNMIICVLSSDERKNWFNFIDNFLGILFLLFHHENHSKSDLSYFITLLLIRAPGLNT